MAHLLASISSIDPPSRSDVLLPDGRTCLLTELSNAVYTLVTSAVVAGSQSSMRGTLYAGLRCLVVPGQFYQVELESSR